MKKNIIIYLACIVLIFSGISCARSEPEGQTENGQDQNGQTGADYEEGFYSIQEDEFDDHGWKPMVTVVVEGSRISKAFYDEINEENRLKSFDQDYLERWKDNSGENLLTAEPKLVAQLLSKQDPDKIDEVSGATSTSEKFKDLASGALTRQPGTQNDTGYYDGLQKAEGEYDERGWKAYVAAIVEEGNIQSAYYDEVNEESGKLKSYDDEYLANWKENSGTNLTEARASLIQDLIDKQDPDDIDTVSGATSTSTKFKELMKEALTP